MTKVQNLKDYAKRSNLFVGEEIPAVYRTEDTPTHLEKWAKETPEFFINNENYTALLFWEVRTQDKGTDREYNYIRDYPELLVMDNKTDQVAELFYPTYQDKAKYSFILPTPAARRYHAASSYMKNEATRDIKTPNKIGVFTESKVQAWFEYLKRYENALSAVIGNLEQENAKNEIRISNFINCIGSAAEVTRYERNVFVSTRFFYVEFTLGKSTGYMGTKIQYTGSIDDIVNLESK